MPQKIFSSEKNFCLATASRFINVSAVQISSREKNMLKNEEKDLDDILI